MKKCFKCQHIKPIDSFYAHKGTNDGHLNKCKSCTKVDVRTWDSNNPEKKLSYRQLERQRNADTYQRARLKRLYNITLENYNEILSSQGNVCAICKKPRPTVVDHDHETGKVRGILHRTCNAGLGMLRDNFDNILNAAKYVQEHKGII